MDFAGKKNYVSLIQLKKKRGEFNGKIQYHPIDEASISPLLRGD